MGNHLQAPCVPDLTSQPKRRPGAVRVGGVSFPHDPEENSQTYILKGFNWKLTVFYEHDLSIEVWN